jgi:hypothetical protein
MGFGAASLQSMRGGWRLPTDDECRIAKPYGGIGQDSNDDGKVAHKALPAGGDSGFNGLLGEDRSEDGHYAQLEVQGFYWTASESGPDRAFSTTLTGAGKLCIFNWGGQALHRQTQGEKQWAFSSGASTPPLVIGSKLQSSGAPVNQSLFESNENREQPSTESRTAADTSIPTTVDVIETSHQQLSTCSNEA